MAYQAGHGGSAKAAPTPTCRLREDPGCASKAQYELGDLSARFQYRKQKLLSVLQPEKDIVLRIKQGHTKLLKGLERQKTGSYPWTIKFKDSLPELCSRRQDGAVAATAPHTYETGD